MNTTKGRIVWLSLFVLLVLTHIADAKIKVFSLVEKTQGANLVLYGNVKELHNDHIVLTVKKALKGSIPKSEVEVPWNKQISMERMVVLYTLGEELLLFTSTTTSNGRYEPVYDWQGVLKLHKGDIGKYEEAISSIEKYDAATSTEEITGRLISMLQSNNQLVQNAALSDFMYSHCLKMLKAGIGEKELGPDVIKLTKHSDTNIAIKATYALTNIGGKGSIPTLIELVGSDNDVISEMASRALVNKTMVEKEVKRGSSIEERKKIQAEWKEWWGKNKDKAKVRR
ncbi:MAG: HEAT repeat domain-containing protein [Candidatus Omnitrophica bacterium]|nr:HEAT repeat domain-containing protein [Candidatus Omnitrophota bacterium]